MIALIWILKSKIADILLSNIESDYMDKKIPELTPMPT